MTNLNATIILDKQHAIINAALKAAQVLHAQVASADNNPKTLTRYTSKFINDLALVKQSRDRARTRALRAPEA